MGAVKRAWTILEDKNTRKACLEVVEEARGRTRVNMEEKRKKLRKEGKTGPIEEDDPERKRQANENKISEDARKQREKELEEEDKREKIKEFEKNWEESRQGRVNSWLDFKKGASKGGGKEKKEKKNKYSPIGFKPPQPKPEQR